jgi:hypothetical protein
MALVRLAASSARATTPATPATPSASLQVLQVLQGLHARQAQPAVWCVACLASCKTVAAAVQQQTSGAFFSAPHGPAPAGIGSLAPHGWRSGTSDGMQASMSLQSPFGPITRRTIEFQRARCAAGARHGLFIGQAQSVQAPLHPPDPRWHTHQVQKPADDHLQSDEHDSSRGRIAVPHRSSTAPHHRTTAAARPWPASDCRACNATVGSAISCGHASTKRSDKASPEHPHRVSSRSRVPLVSPPLKRQRRTFGNPSRAVGALLTMFLTAARHSLPASSQCLACHALCQFVFPSSMLQSTHPHSPSLLPSST